MTTLTTTEVMSEPIKTVRELKSESIALLKDRGFKYAGTLLTDTLGNIEAWVKKYSDGRNNYTEYAEIMENGTITR